MDDSNDRDQDRGKLVQDPNTSKLGFIMVFFSIPVVCSSSGMTYPSTCHMILESERENPEVRNPGPCKNIDRSEMVRFDLHWLGNSTISAWLAFFKAMKFKHVILVKKSSLKRLHKCVSLLLPHLTSYCPTP